MSNLRKAVHLTVDPKVITDVSNKKEFIQNHVLISFISPEDAIKNRFLFEANKFLYTDVNKQIMDTTANIAKTVNITFNNSIDAKIESYKSSEDPVYKVVADILSSLKKEIHIDEDECVAKVLRTYRIDQQELIDRFDAFKLVNDKELESGFSEKFGEGTSVRGFNVRGVYEDDTDAKANAKRIHDESGGIVHTFMAPVGTWCAWDPNADAVQDQEYMVPALDKMMGERKKNVEQKNEFFEKRKQMMMDETDATREKELKDRLQQRIKELKENRTKK